jgi:hypothetical protein
VARGSVVLSSGVTVIHDEAALASTREQAWLLEAVAASGVRLIEVGDPRQSGAVGAGGLWPQIEKAAAERGGLVELSRIVRARDAADRRDQARWRAGEHDQALEGYAARGRVLVEDTQRQAEDRALEAAHEDRRAGNTTLVVVQTSNEALDGLNARAQALRIQDDQLTGDRAVPLAGRPYGLYGGDEIVLRAASTHPELGAVRNGTRGTVVDVDVDGRHATLALADGRQARWDRGQLDAASVRLAYVSHTFPAQGQTVDRAHVIADPLADANGTYVALTRAREQTRIYASVERLSPGEQPHQPARRPNNGPALLEALAEQLGRSTVEAPSIAVALAHEQHVAREHARESTPTTQPRQPNPDADADRGERPRRRLPDPREQHRVRLDRARQQRDQAAAELDRTRGERDQAARVIATLPHDPELVHALADAQYAAGQAQAAAARGQQLTGRLAGLGRFQRLGQPGRTLKAQLVVVRDRELKAAARQRRLEQDAQARDVRLDRQRHAWELEHPGARERHQTAQHAYQHADQRHHAAEQTYDRLRTQDLVNATFPEPAGGQRRWPRPENPPQPEPEHPPRRVIEREGPSFGR